MGKIELTISDIEIICKAYEKSSRSKRCVHYHHKKCRVKKYYGQLCKIHVFRQNEEFVHENDLAFKRCDKCNEWIFNKNGKWHNIKDYMIHSPFISKRITSGKVRDESR